MAIPTLHFGSLEGKSDTTLFTKEDTIAKIDSLINSIQADEKRLAFYKRELEKLSEEEKDADEKNAG